MQGEIIKQLLYVPTESDGPIVQKFSPTMDKTAGEMHPEVLEFMQYIQPKSDKLYVLITALGAGEVWGGNLNADYFPEKALNARPGYGSSLSEADKNNSKLSPLNLKVLNQKQKLSEWEARLVKDPEAASPRPYGYQTFYKAGIYRHHRNKDINRSFGRVVLSVYNSSMYRVELIVEIDRNKARAFGAQNIVDAIDSGQTNIAVSMGAKVKYDRCTRCNHFSYRGNDRCEHILKEKNKIYPDGVKVMMINDYPWFFDLSFVIIPADRIGFVMQKLASHPNLVEGILQGDDISKIAAGVTSDGDPPKGTGIVKDVPSNLMMREILPKLEVAETSLPREVLDMLAKHHMCAFTAPTARGIILKPSEFQRIVLVRAGHGDMADALDKDNLAFTPNPELGRQSNFFYGSGHPPASLLRLLGNFAEERSMFRPFINRRIIKASFGSDNPLPQLLDESIGQHISKMYNAYRAAIVRELPEMDKHAAEMPQNPADADALLNNLWGLSKSGSVPLWPIPALGISSLIYILSAHYKKKQIDNLFRENPEELGRIATLLADDPELLSMLGIGGTMATGKLLKSHRAKALIMTGILGKVATDE